MTSTPPSTPPPSPSPFHPPPHGPELPSGPELSLETAFLTTLAALFLCWGCWSQGGSHLLLALTAVAAMTAVTCVTVAGVRARRLRLRRPATVRDMPAYVTVTRRWTVAAITVIAVAAACSIWRLGTEAESFATVLTAAMIALFAAAGQACRKTKRAADTVLADFAAASR